MIETSDVIEHYGRNDLVERLASVLQAAGMTERLSSSELAPLDHFHARGLAATRELAIAAAVKRGAIVIDIGSGLGGPSRYLAEAFDCQVTGVDLNPTFVEAARNLAARSSIGDKVHYRHADALALPFEDGYFELAWTQHVAMNIRERDRLYAEAFRVLKPNARLAIYDIIAGSGEPLHFPVPWSRGPDTNFVVTEGSMWQSLERQGFRRIVWTDQTDIGVAWLKERKPQGRQISSSVSPLGLDLVMGPDWPTMAANMLRNLIEGRTRIIQAVVERP